MACTPVGSSNDYPTDLHKLCVYVNKDDSLDDYPTDLHKLCVYVNKDDSLDDYDIIPVYSTIDKHTLKVYRYLLGPLTAELLNTPKGTTVKFGSNSLIAGNMDTPKIKERIKYYRTMKDKKIDTLNFSNFFSSMINQLSEPRWSIDRYNPTLVLVESDKNSNIFPIIEGIKNKSIEILSFIDELECDVFIVEHSELKKLIGEKNVNMLFFNYSVLMRFDKDYGFYFENTQPELLKRIASFVKKSLEMGKKDLEYPQLTFANFCMRYDGNMIHRPLLEQIKNICLTVSDRILDNNVSVYFYDGIKLEDDEILWIYPKEMSDRAVYDISDNSFISEILRNYYREKTGIKHAVNIVINFRGNKFHSVSY